jgi:2,4-dienoyl-CoA reductase-like NADH-dependent reductase (Old Yellow Enzyme family)/thioredoxin reductase
MRNDGSSCRKAGEDPGLGLSALRDVQNLKVEKEGRERMTMKLFIPIRIGNLTVRNRIEAAPTHPSLASADGQITRELIDYYSAKARGGAGIVTVGESVVDREYALTHAGQLIIDNDNMVPLLYQLAEAIKRHGARASLELNHGGRQTLPELIGGRNPIAPSPISSPFHEAIAGHPITVREMDEALMDQVVESFAAAVYRLKWAGFDMALIHGGHGWLLGQFLSPYSNKRTDEYGGSLENRARFPLRVLHRIRERVGRDFAIEYRMSGNELIPGGLSTEDAVAFARMMQEYVDCIHVSSGIVADPATVPYFHPPTYLPYGPSVEYAAKIKAAVDIPVANVGGYVDPDYAEQVLQEGKADIIVMGRALIADPDLPRKVRNGKRNEVISCVRCNCCLANVSTFLPLRCAANPVTGRETEFKSIPPASVKKKVVVAGGGPAGIEAACIAASRGHEVTLLEKIAKLGGNIVIAAVPPFKNDMKRFVTYLCKRLEALPVDIRLETEATPEYVKALNPDVVIVAVGAESHPLDVAGSIRAVSAADVLTGKAVGNSVLIAGGGLIGCETALYLARQSKKVTVIEMTDQPAADLNPINRGLLLELLLKEGVEIKTGTKVVAVLEDGVAVTGKDGAEVKLSADSTVLALGMKARTGVVEAFQGLAPEVYAIGDCVSPRKLINAMHEAFNLAVEL